MDKTSLIKVSRLGFGLLIIAAITTQLLTFRQTPINFFSYFTVLSNLMVSSILIISTFNKSEDKYINLVRGATTLYILIAALGFTILLEGKNEEFLSWVNIVLHYVSPLVMTLDWIYMPSTKITFKKSLYWMLFPIFYFGYSMIRGLTTSWYPYNFLDPKDVEYLEILSYAGMIAVGSLILTWLITKLSGRSNYSPKN